MTAPTDQRDPAPEEPSVDAPEQHKFQHPQWMVGVVLIFAVVAIVAGTRDPVWFVIGSPCILVLVIYIWVKLVGRRRAEHYDRPDDPS